MLQNADDAKASTVRFVLDCNNHAGSHLIRGLDEMDGAALLVYNDAEFSKADWKSLGVRNRSKKKEDPTAAGKFGLGMLHR